MRHQIAESQRLIEEQSLTVESSLTGQKSTCWLDNAAPPRSGFLHAWGSAAQNPTYPAPLAIARSTGRLSGRPGHGIVAARNRNVPVLALCGIEDD